MHFNNKYLQHTRLESVLISGREVTMICVDRSLAKPVMLHCITVQSSL